MILLPPTTNNCITTPFFLLIIVQLTPSHQLKLHNHPHPQLTNYIITPYSTTYLKLKAALWVGGCVCASVCHVFSKKILKRSKLL